MRHSAAALTLSAVVVAAWAAACSASGGEDTPPLNDPTDSGAADAPGDVVTPPDDTPIGPANDFPSTPILDAPMGGTPAPAAAPSLFGAPTSGSPTGGPCLIEPETNTLFPRNFLRPRFRFNAPMGHNLFEIRLHTSAEASDLVVYTTATTYVLPAEIWTGLSARAIDTPITMTVRSAKYDAASGKLTDGPSTGTTGTFTIAPAEAAGTIVYWVLPSGGGTATSHLKGFSVGEETVHDVLEPSEIPSSACFGCHTSTPDGQFVALSSSDTASDGSGPAWVEVRSLKDPSKTPPFMTPNAKALLARRDQHGVSFSKAHWAAGDHLILSGLPIAGKTEIVWTDLESTSPDQGVGWDVLARTGDSNAAGGAAWSHDGTQVAYFSAPAIGAGVIDGAGQSDLYVVPFGSKKGGTAVPLYKDVAFASYYPQFSADDKLVAFNRVPRGQSTYNNANAEISVIPATPGSAPVRLAANDPPACMGGKSPGITNSWPKWSPVATPSGGKTYYWLTFSSTRGTGSPQIYVAPVVVSGGVINTYPALYLWNQPANEHNHTPAWDVFSLPIK